MKYYYTAKPPNVRESAKILCGFAGFSAFAVLK
jgi:hypothetical protein